MSTTAASPVWLAPLVVALCPVAAAGQDLPTGGSVAAGAATISAPGPQHMQVDQTSQRAVVDWQSFSVGQDAEVRFNQPGRDAAVLNRVTGGLGSRIDGSVAANGHVYLVNPSGVVVGPTGRVDAQGFVASSLQIDDDDFMGGDLRFSGTGASAAVENHGAISVGHGGYAALLGGEVVNTGTIVAPMGRIGFGAGERAVLDLSGDRFLQIAMPSDTDEEMLIEQAGRVSADGGVVEIGAATAREAARRVVNLSGVTEARSVSGRDGRIVLGGGAGGTVRVTGRVSTAPRPSATLVERSARPAPRPSVEITGRAVELAGAEIDATREGGGSVRIGGDFAGGGELPRAETVTVDAASRIDVSATGAGAGGEAAIWSDVQTRFFGAIDARGAEGAPGGFVEVSSAKRLTFDSAEVQMGPGGTLWLDPETFEICAPGECGGGGSQVTPVSLTSIIDSGSIATVDTSSGEVTGDSGRITVSSPIVSGGTGTLQFSADENIQINAPISMPNGTLELSAAQEIGTSPTGDVNVGTFRLSDGSWRQLNGTVNPDFRAADFRIAPGTDFFRVETAEPLGSEPLVVTDVYGLQGMASSMGPGFDWVLGTDIDASGTVNWNDFGSGPEGFVPIGLDSAFNGTLNGNGNVISGLTVRAPGAAGLFGAIGVDGSVQDLAVANADVSMTGEGGIGVSGAGALAASNFGGVDGVAASGTVTAMSGFGGPAGGLVGENFGAITQSSFIGDVVVTPDIQGDTMHAGGLVGLNYADISESFAEGSVDVTVGPDHFQGMVGGLVGLNVAGDFVSDITDSYADVQVTINAQQRLWAGGLAGINDGTITRASARGNVTGNATGANNSAYVGGLVGQNTGDVTDAYATGAVTASSDAFSYAGGLLGVMFEGIITNTFASGAVSATQSGLPGNVGGHTGRAVDTTEGTGPFGFTGNFWDIDTTGQAASDGTGLDVAEGLTTAEVQDTATFLGLAPFDFANVWAPGTTDGGGIYPQIYTIDPVVFATPDPVTVPYGENPTPFTGTFAGGPPLYVFGDAGDTLDAATVFAGLAPPATDAGIYAFGGSSTADAGSVNYQVIHAPEAFEVTPLPLEITALDQTMMYGDVVLDETQGTGWELTAGTLVAGDSIDAVDLVSAGEAPGADVGLYDIVIESVTGTGLNNYAIETIDATADALTGRGLRIDLRPLEITAFDQTKQGNDDTFVLDEARPEAWDITSGTLVAGDSVDAVDLTSAGAAPGAARGAYRIESAGISGLGLANYAISFVPGTLTVDAITLTLVALDQTKTYKEDGFVLDETAFSISGLEAGDSVESVSLSSPGEAFGADVGIYTITISGADGVGLDNYEITFENGFLTVTPAPLTVSANDQTADPQPDGIDLGTTAFTVDGLRPGDSVDVVQLASDGTAPGTYEILPSNATGAGLLGAGGDPNYAITYVSGVLTINGFPLTITAGDQSKVYNDTAFALDPAAFSVDGLREGDSVESVMLTSDGEAVGAPVGGYDIVPSAAAGTGLENYRVTYESGVLTVTPGELIIAAGDQQKVYGAPDFSLDQGAFSVSGLVAGDSVDNVTLSSDGAALSAPVGGYDIVPSAPVGTGLENYAVTSESGVLTVTPGELIIAAGDQQKVYGAPDFSLDQGAFSVSGLVAGDSVDNVTLSSDGAALSAPVGGYDIVPSAPVGTGLDNYVPVFRAGTLAVNRAPLTIIPLDQTKPEGADFAFEGTEFTTDGLRPVNDDAVTSVELTSEAAGIGGTEAGSPFPIFAANPQGRGLANYEIATGIGTFTVTGQEGIDNEDVPDVIIPPQLPGLPSFTNPDAILVGLAESTSGAAAGRATAGADGGGGTSPQSLQVAESALAVITRASDSLSVTAAVCRETEGQVTDFLGCISDALDAFSATLDPAQLDLAPELSNVSSAVIVARQRIDAARALATRRLAGTTDPAERRQIEREAVGEARAALADASAEISAAITLIRADDPELEGVFRAQGEEVLTAVSSVDLELQRAVGL